MLEDSVADSWQHRNPRTARFFKYFFKYLFIFTKKISPILLTTDNAEKSKIQTLDLVN